MEIKNLTVDQLRLSQKEVTELLALLPTHVVRKSLEDAGLIPGIIQGATDIDIKKGFKQRCYQVPGAGLAQDLRVIALDVQDERQGVAA